MGGWKHRQKGAHALATCNGLGLRLPHGAIVVFSYIFDTNRWTGVSTIFLTMLFDGVGVGFPF
jgi:hypothetical protein